MPAFIAYWSKQEREEWNRRKLDEGKPLHYASNNQYVECGVTIGDDVYLVAVADGKLLLLARLSVDEMMTLDEARGRLGDEAYAKASDHLFGRGTTLRFDRVVPENDVRLLRRASGKAIKIDATSYQVDHWSVHRTGQVTPESAAVLDGLLDELVGVDLDEVLAEEGGRTHRRRQVIERSAQVRARALELHGTQCCVCGLSYALLYGDLGQGFAEVHHLAPLSEAAGAVSVNPLTDVVVLCANCHRMVHRRDPPLPPDELRDVINAGPYGPTVATQPTRTVRRTAIAGLGQ